MVNPGAFKFQLIFLYNFAWCEWAIVFSSRVRASSLVGDGVGRGGRPLFKVVQTPLPGGGGSRPPLGDFGQNRPKTDPPGGGGKGPGDPGVAQSQKKPKGILGAKPPKFFFKSFCWDPGGPRGPPPPGGGPGSRVAWKTLRVPPPPLPPNGVGKKRPERGY